ncbi:helix-turn-helix domain-containing protein [Burkholderia pseudomultivorans]|uniref:XRE family transcriptional regulator n=1 Tax=Burkholderia pseudomultivorans TaxID=1207504 RepID=A0A132ENB0_9BURK|nr:helix-turn-helix transcriptional regulator [Burkholderia pseudomultivorans]KWF38005.1 XRE family transcriptional regulator [Burkholderia pseudomultivorans]
MAFPVQTLGQLRPILVGFRKSAGLTQAQLAARLGVTQQSYAQLESNPSAVSIERLFKVLNVLGVRLTLDPVLPDETGEAGGAGAGHPQAGDAGGTGPADTRTTPAAGKATAPRRASAVTAATAKTPDGAARKRPAAARARRSVAKREDW